jgi:hypothetical protein
MKQMLHRCNLPIHSIFFTIALRFIPQTKDVLHFSRVAGKPASNNIQLFQIFMN